MNCVIFTHDYPFGTAEPFFENEILYTSKYFEKVFIFSLSSNNLLTRKVPKNVFPIKLSLRKYFIRSSLYTIRKIFSKEAYYEYLNVKKLEHKPSIISMIKWWLHTWMLEKRYSTHLKKMNLDNHSTVLYSYWLSLGAYIIAKNEDRWKYKMARVHAFEIRDYETYIPFRQIIDRNLNEIFFISESTKAQYNRIIKKTRTTNSFAKQEVKRLGVFCEEVKYLPKKSSSFQILSCSSIVNIKRLDLIIKILASIEEEVNWTHLGWGIEGDRISIMCQELLGEKQNIQWNLLGKKSNSEVLDYYRNNKIDLFVNMSDNEGVPVSIMEAMSFGIPCLARDVGGIGEIVKDGETGFLLDPSLPVLLMSKKLIEILKLLDAENKSKEFFTATSNFIQKYYNTEKNYNEFYQRLM